MSELKVKFHSLERLELTDINAIQDIAETIRDDYAGNLFGAEGALSRIDYTYALVNEGTDNEEATLSFNTFVFLGKKDLENAGTTNYEYFNRAFLGIFDDERATSTSSLDVTTLRKDAQTFFDANNTLPTIDNNIDGNIELFPHIWVCAFNADSSKETRRTWDLSNDREQTLDLDTKVERRFKFKTKLENPPAKELDHTPWVKVGRIWSYVVTNDVVGIDEIRTHFISEDLLGIEDKHPATLINKYGSIAEENPFNKNIGLKHTLNIVKDFLNNQLTNGSNDPANTTTKSLIEQPTYSLQGIAYKLDNSPTVKKASAHVTIDIDYQGTSPHDRVSVTVTNYTPNGVGASHPAWIPIEGVGIDYQDFYERNTTYKEAWKSIVNPYRVVSEATLDDVTLDNLTITESNRRLDLKRWASVLTSWYIKIGSEYADALYSINLTPLYEGGSTTEVEKYELYWDSAELSASVVRPWDIVHSVKGPATGRVLGGAAPAAVVTQYTTWMEINNTFTGAYFKLKGLDDGENPVDSRSYLLNKRVSTSSSAQTFPAISGSKQFRFLIDMEIYQ